MRPSEGFTLLELVVAIALGSVVLLTSSNFLINFSKYTSNLIKSEASLMGTTLGAFEEIAYKITHANEVVVGAETAMDVPPTARPAGCLTDGTCIQIRLDTGLPAGCGVAPLCSFSPSDYTNDTVFNYWKSGTDLYRSFCTTADGCTTSDVIARDIFSASFTRPGADMDRIRVQIEARVASGATTGTLKESLDTIAFLRGRSAN